MKCPKCGAEMRKGFIQTSRGDVYFTEVPHKMIPVAHEEKGDVSLLEFFRLFPRCPGHICEECQISVMEYGLSRKRP